MPLMLSEGWPTPDLHFSREKEDMWCVEEKEKEGVLPREHPHGAGGLEVVGRPRLSWRNLSSDHLLSDEGTQKVCTVPPKLRCMWAPDPEQLVTVYAVTTLFPSVSGPVPIPARCL